MDVTGAIIDEQKEFEKVVVRLDRDLKASLANLSVEEARVLVQSYYRQQDNRIRAEHQNRQIAKAEKQHEAIEWLAKQDETLENRVKQMLDIWTDSMPMGIWAKKITGIGPVISAGLLAYINIEQAPTVGHIWRYAGLDPTAQRKKGEKLKYNPDLKVLCFKIGDSFVKQQSRETDVYGKFYLQRKDYEQKRNEAGLYRDQAAHALATRNFVRDTEAKKTYESGKLPPGHIHFRSMRWAVKLFLAHWHDEAYRQHYGTEPPLPYPIAILGHAHKIDGPH